MGSCAAGTKTGVETRRPLRDSHPGLSQITVQDAGSTPHAAVRMPPAPERCPSPHGNSEAGGVYSAEEEEPQRAAFPRQPSATGTQTSSFSVGDLCEVRSPDESLILAAQGRVQSSQSPPVFCHQGRVSIPRGTASRSLHESRAGCPRQRWGHRQRGKEDTAPCRARGSWLEVAERYVLRLSGVSDGDELWRKRQKGSRGRAADTESLSASESLPSSTRARLCVCALLSITPRPAGLSEADAGLEPAVLSRSRCRLACWPTEMPRPSDWS